MSQPLTRPSLRIVEDHEDYEFLIGLLGGEWRCTHARSVAETELAICHGGAFDLVLADLTLPNGAGMDILRRVRACVPPETRVVVLTIHNDSIVQSEAMRFADDYLVKDAPGLDIPGRLRLALQRTTTARPSILPTVEMRPVKANTHKTATLEKFSADKQKQVEDAKRKPVRSFLANAGHVLFGWLVGWLAGWGAGHGFPWYATAGIGGTGLFIAAPRLMRTAVAFAVASFKDFRSDGKPPENG